MIYLVSAPDLSETQTRKSSHQQAIHKDIRKPICSQNTTNQQGDWKQSNHN